MKKIIILLTIMVASITAAFAAQPQYFAFEIGTGAAFNPATGAISTATDMGFTYSFSDTFKGGFSFKDITGVSLDTLSISVVPADKITLTMYTGRYNNTNLAFGAGFGYDFFTNAKSLFTSLGVYIDWFGSNGGTIDVATGGVLCLGLKTKIGI